MCRCAHDARQPGFTHWPAEIVLLPLNTYHGSNDAFEVQGKLIYSSISLLCGTIYLFPWLMWVCTFGVQFFAWVNSCYWKVYILSTASENWISYTVSTAFNNFDQSFLLDCFNPNSIVCIPYTQTLYDYLELHRRRSVYLKEVYVNFWKNINSGVVFLKQIRLECISPWLIN